MPKKQRPPPDPDDFEAPTTTRGWHTLSDAGWVLVQRTSTCKVPDDPLICRVHEFDATFEGEGWKYRFRLADHTGTQTNVDTHKVRICQWFEPSAPSSTAATTVAEQLEASNRSNMMLNEALEAERVRRMVAEQRLSALEDRCRASGIDPAEAQLMSIDDGEADEAEGE